MITGSISDSTQFDKIGNFVKDYHIVLEEYKVKKEDVCIIVYKTVNYPFYYKEIYKIYKSIDEFTNKIENDIMNIETKFGISFEVWIYD